MALRDAAHEIAPIQVHSVEWSDRSVPVQKRTFSGPYVHNKRDTIRKSARWSVWFLHSPMTTCLAVQRNILSAEYNEFAKMRKPPH